MSRCLVQDERTGFGVDQLCEDVAAEVVNAEAVRISEPFSPPHATGLQHLLVVISDLVRAVVGEGFGQLHLKLGHQLG